MATIWTAIFTAESVGIVLGNVLTIAAIANERSLKKRGNWLIINLAMADLLVGLVSEPMYISILKGNYAISKVYTPLDISLGMASVFGLTALALDRLLAITRPFQHRVTSDRTYVLCIVFMWITAGLIACFILTSRFVMFFYVVLPLLTISQFIILVSYIAIWAAVKARRPKVGQGSIYLSEISGKTKSHHKQKTESPSQYQSTQTKYDPPQPGETGDRHAKHFHSSTEKEKNKTSHISRQKQYSVELKGSQTGRKKACCGLEQLKSITTEDDLNGTGEHSTGKYSNGKTNFLKGSEDPFNRHEATIVLKQTAVRPLDAPVAQEQTSGLTESDTGQKKNFYDPKKWSGWSKQQLQRHKRTQSCIIKQVGCKQSTARHCHSKEMDSKLALTLFIATALSLLAWMPFEIMNIVLYLCFPCRRNLDNVHILYFTKFLHYSNSIVNPVIYTFRISEFRKAIVSLLTFWTSPRDKRTQVISSCRRHSVTNSRARSVPRGALLTHSKDW